MYTRKELLMTPLLILIALLSLWTGACATVGYLAGDWLASGE
jgi:hypothetical protein